VAIATSELKATIAPMVISPLITRCGRNEQEHRHRQKAARLYHPVVAHHQEVRFELLA
jgi:hypothetical protein